MQRFVETFDEPAYAVDHELIITAWNRRAEQIFGWPAEDAIGHSADERLQPSYDWQLRRKRVTAMLAVGWWAGLTVLLDRHEIPHAFQGVCWRLFAGTTRRYLTVLHDHATGLHIENVRLQLPGTPCPPGGTVPLNGTDKIAWPVPAWGTMEAEMKNPRKALCAANLRIRRTQAGLTQDDVAENLGVGREKVSHWEHGREPIEPTLQKLAALYGCKLEDFYAPLTNGDKAEL